MTKIDETDLRILEILSENGRESWKQIAETVGLSAPSVLERVRKLERTGTIRGYTVQLDPERVGSGLLAFVSVVGSGPDYHTRLRALLDRGPEIQECHLTAGGYDYLLKVRCGSPEHLTRFLQSLRGDDGVQTTHTTVTLATLKETPRLPIRSGPELE